MKNLPSSFGFEGVRKLIVLKRALRKTSKKSIKAHKKAKRFGKNIVLAKSLKAK